MPHSPLLEALVGEGTPYSLAWASAGYAMRDIPSFRWSPSSREPCIPPSPRLIPFFRQLTMAGECVPSSSRRSIRDGEKGIPRRGQNAEGGNVLFPRLPRRRERGTRRSLHALAHERGGTWRSQADGSQSLKVVMPFGAVKAAGLLTTVLESGVPIRRDRGRSGRASREAPCRRARHGGRARPGFRRGIPACAYGWA
jgi:hypothetical protein